MWCLKEKWCSIMMVHFTHFVFLFSLFFFCFACLLLFVSFSINNLYSESFVQFFVWNIFLLALSFNIEFELLLNIIIGIAASILFFFIANPPYIVLRFHYLICNGLNSHLCYIYKSPVCNQYLISNYTTCTWR